MSLLLNITEETDNCDPMKRLEGKREGGKRQMRRRSWRSGRRGCATPALVLPRHGGQPGGRGGDDVTL